VKLYSAKETAHVLGVSVRTLRRMRAAGEIGCVTVGTGRVRPRVRFTEEHLGQYLARADRNASALPAARR
jgi:excisionase family DNA binding protein